MERRFEFEPTRKNRYRLSRIIWILKIAFVTSIGIAIIFYLMSDKSNPKGILLISIIFFGVIAVISAIVYFTGFTDEHKIITLTDTELRSELKPSNNTFRSAMNFKIKLTNIERIKVHSHGFTVFPKRKRKFAWHWTQSNDQYLQLINVPKVLNDYEELLNILKNRKTCANNGEHEEPL